MEKLNHLFMQKLVQMRAFSLQLELPFRWGNGWLAPVYFDDRRLLSYIKMRNFTKLELGRVVAELYPDADVIAGVATNAVAHGVLVAEQLDLPFVSVYPQPKDHGLENQIEGDLRPRQKVVVIENQVNVGENAERVIDALRASGCMVLGVVTLFDYEMPEARARLSEAGVALTSLCSFSDLIVSLRESGLYAEDDVLALEDWHASPATWHAKD